MAITAIIFAIILSIIGLIGSIVPGLPGPILGYIGLLLVHLYGGKVFSTNFLILRGVINIALLIIDYCLPIRGTKKFGGSKRGNTGCIIGMIGGIFAGPIGLIVGPFIGALIGEYLHTPERKKSIKSACGALIGFASGIILKLIIGIIMLAEILSLCFQQHFF